MAARESRNEQNKRIIRCDNSPGIKASVSGEDLETVFTPDDSHEVLMKVAAINRRLLRLGAKMTEYTEGKPYRAKSY